MNSNIGVQLHSNGLFWQARWWDSSRVRQTKSLGAKAKVSKRQARELCKELAIKHAVTPAARDVGKSPTLGEWRDQYMELRDDIKELTLGLHDRTFRYLIERFGEGLPIDRITDATAEDFRVWLGKQPGRAGKTLGAHTVAAHVRNCKAIFERARRRKIVASNPFADVSGSAPAVSKNWAEITAADLAKIIDKCPDSSWRCLFSLARLAGLRRGEALRLTWRDVDFDARTVQVWPEGGVESSKQRARVVPMDAALYAILRDAYDAADEGATEVCAGIAVVTVHAKAAAIIKAAGLPAYSKPFHTLRKCLESQWMAEFPTMIVCNWLGHSATVAMAHYHRPRPEDIARVTGIQPKGTIEAQKLDSRA